MILNRYHKDSRFLQSLPNISILTPPFASSKISHRLSLVFFLAYRKYYKLTALLFVFFIQKGMTV